jgi:pimeloyl-ACP methyl ester carboxylesterase
MPPAASRVHFEDIGSGPPLVPIHGLMVSGRMFEPVASALSAHHRLIIPDLRGHGRSRALPPPYNTRQLAADIADILDSLGIAKADILGYSQGGAVAQQFALDRPDRCHRLILACTYAHNMATSRERFEGRLGPILLQVLGPRRLAKLVVSRGAKELDKEGADWLSGLMASNDKKLMVSAVKEMTWFDSRQQLGEIRCPTLVIAGTADTAVPMHHARMLVDGIPNARLEVVKGAGHTLIWTHPEEFVRLIEAFASE